MKTHFGMKLRMAQQNLRSGRVGEAEALFRQVLASEPGHVAAAAALAALYTGQNKFRAAIDVLDAARSDSANRADALIQLGTAYKNLGKFEEAKDCYRRAIPLDESLAPGTHLALATTCRFSAYDDDVRSMEGAWRDSEPTSSARRYLAFALGKVFDDLQDYDRAFPYFREGNQIAAASTAGLSMGDIAERFAKFKATLGVAFVERYAPAAIDDSTPIFVTGLPRSGTTLVEQILASHPAVHGCGEIDKLGGMLLRLGQSIGADFPDGLDAVAPDIYRKIASTYVEYVAHGKPHTTDKSIANFVFVGVIRALLPNAGIVLCRRDPRDLGLSSFQVDLGESYPWSSKLEWIGQYCRCFDDLVDHWLRSFPGQIHVVHYEHLVADPERQIRKLLAHCGLAFDPACLEFYRKDKVVATASRDQVRRPIYATSIGRWKNYEKHLGPLISALGPANVTADDRGDLIGPEE